jgi:hypothetical protein
MEAMRALEENKSRLRILTDGGHGQSTKILKGIFRHLEIQGLKKRSNGLIAGEVHGLQVAHQVQGGGDQGGSVGATSDLAGATSDLAGATRDSNNSDAGEAGSRQQ